MQGWKGLGVAILIYGLSFLLLAAGGLEAHERAPEDAPAKLEIYVAPFSHLDLFWAGTREECLARGNRIFAKAIQIAQQHPEFRFFIESNNFLANFVETHGGTADEQSTVAGFDMMRADLAAKGRKAIFERIEGADHSLRRPGGSPGDGLRDAFRRIAGRFMPGTR